MFKVIKPLPFLIATSFLMACSPKESNEIAPVVSLPSVDAIKVQSTFAKNWLTYTSTLEAAERVILKPRVSGTIESVNYLEGSLINQGDVLFSLDSAPFQAEVNRLEANLIQAKEALKQAQREAGRAKRLIKERAISTEHYEARLSQAKQNEAIVKSISAQLERAKLDLSYTDVLAPISGIASRAHITAGNTVSAFTSELTNIISTGEIHAYFEIEERTWNHWLRNVELDNDVEVRMTLNRDSDEQHSGTIDFSDNAVDPLTGTITVRAVFDNPANRIKPGSFARIAIAPKENSKRLMIPERSIITDLENKSVLVINDNKQLEQRTIQIGKQIGKYRIVTSGISEGELITLNGAARAHSGMTVEPTITVPAQL